MKVRCARCHTAFDAEGEDPKCPTCGATSGLEPVHAPELPMRMFAGLLGLAIAIAAAGALVTRVSG